MLSICSVGASKSAAMASMLPISEGSTLYLRSISIRYVGVPLPNQYESTFSFAKAVSKLNGLYMSGDGQAK